MAHLYRPSVVVNLKLAFDEAFQVIESRIADPVSVEELAEKGRVGVEDKPRIRPLILEAAEDNVSFITERVPRSANVELPGFRQAGQFDLTFSWKDLPIDPRVIRSCGVEVHIGTVGHKDFALGMMKNYDRTRQNRLPSILNTKNDAGEPRVETLRMVGLVDTWTAEHNEGGSEVKLHGRDLRGVLLDSPIEPKMLSHLNLENPIDEVVKEILEKHPLSALFVVECKASDWDNDQIPSPYTKDGLTKVRQSADGKKTRGKPPADSASLNFWDVITWYCSLVGAIPYFVGFKLRIRQARSLYDLRDRGGYDIETPFKDGQTRKVLDSELRTRRIAYGRDALRINFERKLGGVKPRIIECVSINLSATGKGREQKLLVARYPSDDNKKAQATTRSPNHKAASKDVIRISLPGIKNKQQLEEIARSIFEEVGRGECGGSCETKALASFGGGNSDPDMLRLMPGDAVEFVVDTNYTPSSSPLVAELIDHHQSSFEELVNKIYTRIGDMNLARVLAGTARNAVVQLQSFFRVATVKYLWDASEHGGIKVQFDFQNYIEARYGGASGKAPLETLKDARSSFQRNSGIRKVAAK